MRGAQREDLGEGDSAEGVPEEEGTDEETGDGLQQVSALVDCRCSSHADTPRCKGRCEVAREAGWVSGR